VIPFFICFGDEQVKRIRTHIDYGNFLFHRVVKAREDTNFRNLIKNQRPVNGCSGKYS
jgi:hypothetical protein